MRRKAAGLMSMSKFCLSDFLNDETPPKLEGNFKLYLVLWWQMIAIKSAIKKKDSYLRSNQCSQMCINASTTAFACIYFDQALRRLQDAGIEPLYCNTVVFSERGTKNMSQYLFFNIWKTLIDIECTYLPICYANTHNCCWEWKRVEAFVPFTKKPSV